MTENNMTNKNMNTQEKFSPNSGGQQPAVNPNNRTDNREFRVGNRGEGRERPKSEYEEHVLQVDRVSRTVKGGKRVRFRALVIIGNRNGKVAMGVGKAAEVQAAVQKATTIAKREILEVAIKNETIPYPVDIHHGAAHIILKPAKPGTSVIAGGTIRVICNLAGIRNLTAKILGTANKINNAQTMMIALKLMAKRFKEENETT